MDVSISSAWGTLDRRLKALPDHALLAVALSCGAVHLATALMGADHKPAEFMSLATIGWAAHEISGFICSAIIIGAVMKVLLIQGYFETALRNVMLSRSGVELISRERRIELWRHLYVLIYEPTFYRAGQANEFIQKVERAATSYLAYKEKFYLEHVTRRLTFEEVENAAGIVRLTDVLEGEIVPFDPTSPVEWRSVRKASPGCALDLYVIDFEDVAIDGEDIDQRRVGSDTGSDVVTTYHLRGKNRYRIRRKRVQRWPIKDDPCFTIRSPYITERGSIEVENKLLGSRILLQPLGTDGLVLTPSAFTAPGEGNWYPIKDVILPNQGYQCIICG